VDKKVSGGYGDFIFTPQEVAALGVRGIERARDGQSRAMRFDFGHEKINSYIAPLIPPQTAVIIAQTSNFKTGFMRCVSRMWANQLEREGRTDECIIYVSLEETVEESSYFDFERYSGDAYGRNQERAGSLARGVVENWDTLLAASTKVAGVPIYRIGDSLEKPRNFRELYLSNIQNAIMYMVSGRLGFPVKPAAILVDYLQALPPDPGIRSQGEDAIRRLQVRQDVYGLRDMGKFIGCPVFFASQAKQHLDNEVKGDGWRLPGLYDGSEAKEVADRPDRVYDFWLPKMTSAVGTIIEHGNFKFKVEENLAFLRVAKQRGGLPSGAIFPMRINFTTGDIFFDSNFNSLP
jgi:hypothetical protein